MPPPSSSDVFPEIVLLVITTVDAVWTLIPAPSLLVDWLFDTTLLVRVNLPAATLMLMPPPSATAVFPVTTVSTNRRSASSLLIPAPRLVVAVPVRFPPVIRIPLIVTRPPAVAGSTLNTRLDAPAAAVLATVSRADPGPVIV